MQAVVAVVLAGTLGLVALAGIIKVLAQQHLGLPVEAGLVEVAVVEVAGMVCIAQHNMLKNIMRRLAVAAAV